MADDCLFYMFILYVYCKYTSLAGIQTLYSLDLSATHSIVNSSGNNWSATPNLQIN